MDFQTMFFEDKNTCIDGRITKRNYNSAENYAVRSSKIKGVYKIIVANGDWFVEYKNGIKTAWSI